MSNKLAIVGGTGAVGRVFIEYLKTHELPIDEIKIVASSRSAGKSIHLNGSEIVVEDIENFDFSSVNFAFFSAGSEVAKKFAPIAKESGCTVIDNYKVKRVDVATYQSVSGTGKEAIDELTDQSKNFLEGNEVKKNIYSSQIAFNVLPGANRPKLDNGYTEEEMKMTWEAQKILDESIQVTASCARVPVFYGHSEAVHIETELEINLDEMISKMQSFPGLKVINSDTKFNPTPLDDAEGKDEVFVGSIRKDLWKENRVNLWVISDNLRKGAALNSMQILKRLIEKQN